MGHLDVGIDSARLFEAVFDDSLVLQCLLSPDGTVLRANEAALGSVDATLTELQGEPFAAWQWWGEATPRDALAEYVDLAASGEFVRFRIDGAGTVSIRPVFGDDAVVALVVEVVDATTDASDRLDAMEAKLAALHDVATDLERCESLEEIYELTVGAAEEILELHLCYVGIVEDDVIVPKATSSRAGPDHVEPKSLDEGLAGKTVRTGESYIIESVTPDDETEPAREDYRSGLSVPIGEFGVFQAVGTEVSAFDGADLELAETLIAHVTESIKRVRSERSLERQNERLEEFAGVVAHDLRNPLNVISGHAEIASTEVGSEHAESIKQSAERMEELIDDLLQLAQAGELSSEPRPVTLATGAREAWEDVPTADATLSVGTAMTVEADQSRLRQLFENLFRNAVEHGGDTVAVEVGELDDGDGFYVADDGPGVPAGDRERIFESGFSSADGTGFGLAIVEEIAEAHGWSVRVTESASGGARFEVRGVDLV